eukprot:TRINITY_DN60243_c0_g1_i1.p1 TRINITY_DN60243_c0_g1~~TRINITY_DN60243_c0_g1_i1.p1  ORF type:complete len:587 (+),score=217.16 TRINITY_DN60243_c0_g1_i1:86-1846(+)
MGKKKPQKEKAPAGARGPAGAAGGAAPGGSGAARAGALRRHGEDLAKLLAPPEDRAQGPPPAAHAAVHRDPTAPAPAPAPAPAEGPSEAGEAATLGGLLREGEHSVIDLQGCAALTELPLEALLQQQLRDLSVADCGLGELPAGPEGAEADEDAEGAAPLLHLSLPRNRFSEVPRGVLQWRATLQTLNLSGNRIAGEPPAALLSELSALVSLDLSSNALDGRWGVDGVHLPRLTSLNLAGNKLTCVELAADLPQLRSLFVQRNCLTELPAELADHRHLRELKAGGNPIREKKVLKLVENERGFDLKQLQKELRGGRSRAQRKGSERQQVKAEIKRGKAHRVLVLRQKGVTVRSLRAARSHRPHLVVVAVEHMALSGEGALRRFIKMQTELHKELCDRRSAATIGTHDLAKVDAETLTYDAVPGDGVRFRPLKQAKAMTPAEIVAHYERHDEHMKQHLRLIRESDLYAVLRDAGEVLSMAPLVNSEYSAVSAGTRSCLVEVTSDVSLDAARRVMSALLVRLCYDGLSARRDVEVRQCRIVGEGGELLGVYPSHQDLEDDPGVALVFEAEEMPERPKWFRADSSSDSD